MDDRQHSKANQSRADQTPQSPRAKIKATITNNCCQHDKFMHTFAANYLIYSLCTDTYPAIPPYLVWVGIKYSSEGPVKF